MLSWPQALKRARIAGRSGAALPVAAALLALAGCAGQPPAVTAPGWRPPRGIVLVQAVEAARSEAERNLARSVASRLSLWLTATGLKHAVVTDAELNADIAEAAGVVILGYNPHPTARQLRLLRQVLRNGGKLIVFYGSDPALAAMMDVRLGAYTAARAADAWSGFAFNRAAPPFVPDVVAQDSASLFPAYPAAPTTRVIACWQSARGTATSVPAWLQSAQGYWMTHIFLASDAAAKQQLLLALIGDALPAAWRAAADHAVNGRAPLGAFSNLTAALQSLERQGASAAPEPCADLLRRARRLEADRREYYAAHKYPAVVRDSGALRTILTEAYARLQPRRLNEFRAAWNLSGTGLYPGDWERTCRLLAESGLTAIFPQVATPAAAHFASGVTPRSEVYRQQGDQLAQCVAAAHRHGLEAHAWKICWNLEAAPESYRERLRVQERLQVSDTGEDRPWLCPSHPANRALELQALVEIARGYAVDGIHLDFIRYKDAHTCYCAGCRARFERTLGRPVKNWPADVQREPLLGAYRRWRADQIGQFVASVARHVRRIRPGLRLSAAVYGSYPGIIASIGQDWGAWLQRGDLDFVCPMNYTPDTAQFVRWTQRELALPAAAGRIVPGVGVTALDCRLDAVQTIDQIQAARRAGAGGFILFDLNRTLEKDILPLLRLGATAP